MMPSPAQHALPLDNFPLLRSTELNDACIRIGHWFSPHRLQLNGDDHGLNVKLNKIVLRDTAIHVLHYGADVTIDPGKRGDFYMLMLPISGKALVVSGNREAMVDPSVLSVLHPRAATRMRWSADCAMMLLQVPTHVMRRRVLGEHSTATPNFAISASRADPRVAAWWAATEDMVRNLDRFAPVWLSSAAAVASFEDFLLSSFAALSAPAVTSTRRALADVGAGAASQRAVTRAKEYIQAHLRQGMTLDDIANHACVSTRSLEQLFKRHEDTSPMSYVRQQRLRAVHEALSAPQRELHESVTQIALAYGFTHLGRFASLYREVYGCSPSVTGRSAGRRDDTTLDDL